MKIILKIGMDVHSTKHALCAIMPRVGEEAKVIAQLQISADYKNIVRFIEKIKADNGKENEYDIECGYEAGCIGFSLYRQLTAAKVKCTILAPTTIPMTNGRVKTDPRDALDIAHALAYGTYKAVHVPTEEDDAVKEYIRMREDHKNSLKRLKQQINAMCLRHGHHYAGSKWTLAHLKWIGAITLPELVRETLNEYMATFEESVAKIQRYDARIEEIASGKRYCEKVRKLGCFLGIKTHTALSLLAEISDFSRFSNAGKFAAYLGFVPGEHSSGLHILHTGITKAGNGHLRREIIECASALCRGRIGHKSKALLARQKGNSTEVIAYADRANCRLRSKYYKLMRQGKHRNKAVTAVGRELACFVWGMVTDHMDMRME